MTPFCFTNENLKANQKVSSHVSIFVLPPFTLSHDTSLLINIVEKCSIIDTLLVIRMIQ